MQIVENMKRKSIMADDNSFDGMSNKRSRIMADVSEISFDNDDIETTCFKKLVKSLEIGGSDIQYTPLKTSQRQIRHMNTLNIPMINYPMDRIQALRNNDMNINVVSSDSLHITPLHNSIAPPRHNGSLWDALMASNECYATPCQYFDESP